MVVGMELYSYPLELLHHLIPIRFCNRSRPPRTAAISSGLILAIAASPGRPGDRMQRCKSQFPLLVVIAAIIGLGIASAQETSRPWMDSHLSPGERSELVLKQLTLDEKLALVHGNGMSGEPQWRMPLTTLTNGGAGYTQGVERLGIPPLIISDAGYGVRASGASGRYSTAMPSNLGAASSWDPESVCQFGEVIGGELRAQGFDVTLGGGVNLTREPRNGRTFEYAGEDPLLAGTLVGNMMKCEQDQHVIGVSSTTQSTTRRLDGSL